MNTANANVIVYVRQPVSAEQGRRLREAIGELRGVSNATASRRATTLMCVDYDPSAVDSQRILNAVTSRGYSARLVGM